MSCVHVYFPKTFIVHARFRKRNNLWRKRLFGKRNIMMLTLQGNLFQQSIGPPPILKIPSYGDSVQGNSVTLWVAPHVCNWAPPKRPRTSFAAPHVGLAADARSQPYVGAIAAGVAPSYAKWPVPGPPPPKAPSTAAGRNRPQFTQSSSQAAPYQPHTLALEAASKFLKTNYIFVHTTRSATISRA